MQCIDLYLKIIVNKTYDWIWVVYLSLIFIGPAIPAAYVGGVQLAGFSGATPFCFENNNGHLFDQDIDAGLFYIPILIITTLGVLIMLRVMTKIASTVGNSAQISASDTENSSHGGLHLSRKVTVQLQVLRTPILFCVLFLVIWVSLFCYRGVAYQNSKANSESFGAWVGCIFSVFATSGDQVNIDITYIVFKFFSNIKI